MTTPTIPVWRAITVAFIACAAIAAAGVFYTRQVQRESDQRWCALLVRLDDAYRTPPGPGTDTGKAVAAEVSLLRDRLSCPPPLDPATT